MSSIDTAETPRLSRRGFAASLGALATAAALPRAFGQAPTFKVRKLHCFEIRVSDVPRAVDFYQGLFGLAVQARSAERTCLRIGEGPQFMAVRQIQAGETPAIAQLGYSLDQFDASAVQSGLRLFGFEVIEAPPVTASGIEHAMKTWMRERGDTLELYFADAQGLIVQLSSPTYCGGGGPEGDRCDAVEPAKTAGRLRLQDLNHFTVFGSDGAGANRFYQQMFGLKVQAYQGPGSPVTGIGDGRQFVMYAGGGGRGGRGGAATPANIHHGSFNMHDFNVERVLATLTDYGLTARGDGGRTGPLMHYVSLRMPERGGAEGGTPELYFTDPDGILLQLQDVTYCGGGGYLGSECL